MKKMITFSIFAMSTLGSLIGAAMTGGNEFSGLSILLSIVGSFAGVWVGYKAGQYLDL